MALDNNQTPQSLEDLLLEAINSEEEPTEITPEFWVNLRAEALAEYERRKALKTPPSP